MPGAQSIDEERARARRGLVGTMARALARTDPTLRVGKVRVHGDRLHYGLAAFDLPKGHMTGSELFEWTACSLLLLAAGDRSPAPASVPVP